ncbi:MAG: M61 family metallopeptidase [Deltaproteobacteria bacterium]|jgi:predicted metalloprotease with PDZ domain|nr:M61 family metallopeptidase [Deltaproteobacteria bacterium]MBT6435748.1 M61 family metallopeptidase [Deltaproteobacteria bacterium]
MKLVSKLVFCCLVLSFFLASCQSDDYVAPSREPLALEPLEIATNIAPPSSEYDVYDIDFTQFAQRYIDVTMSLECPNPCHLKMATWTPGSYLIREYARNISRLTASTTDGKKLGVTKLDKNTWQVEAKPSSQIQVVYRLYANELSVRTNFLTHDYGIINGASTFLYVTRENPRPSKINVRLPKGWGVDTGLKKLAENSFESTSLDELIDSPFIVGDIKSYHFEISKVPHRVSMVGDLRFWDLDKKVGPDVERLTQEIIAHWGIVPYESYAYLNVVDKGRGGLEHLDSTLMISRPRSPRSREAYLSWLGLVSHEFYHTWNVKRLRPKALGPFDYQNENYSRSLWIAEGITSYYDDLILRRAGLLTDKEYFEKLSKQLAYVENSVGSTVQSLSDSSHDAWIKFYRKDDNSPNTMTSYYSKGAAVGFLLDMTLRQMTNERVTLDTFMKEAYERYCKDGFTTQEFRALATELAGKSLDTFFAKFVDGTAPLEHEPALSRMGLRWKAQEAEKPDEGYPKSGWAGWTLQESKGVFVKYAEEGAPAHGAGIAPGDEVVAIDGYRTRTTGEVEELLSSFGEGTSVDVALSRRGRLLNLKLMLKAVPKRLWELEVSPQASARNKQRRARWLSTRVVGKN